MRNKGLRMFLSELFSAGDLYYKVYNTVRYIHSRNKDTKSRCDHLIRSCDITALAAPTHALGPLLSASAPPEASAPAAVKLRLPG